MASVLFTDRLPVAHRILGQLNYWGNIIGTTAANTVINANNTCAALATAVTAESAMGSAVPYMTARAAADVGRAINLGVDEGIWSESHGFTTLAGFTGAVTDFASGTNRNNIFG